MLTGVALKFYAAPLISAWSEVKPTRFIDPVRVGTHFHRLTKADPVCRMAHTILDRCG